MTRQQLSTEEVGIDCLGQLSLCSGWSSDIGFSEVHHAVDTNLLHVEPKSVLFWDGNFNRQNSLKRFAHMLRWRGVAPLTDLEAYQTSLDLALSLEKIDLPTEPRLRTLGNLVARYQVDASEGMRITRLAASTARILFSYEPPLGEDLRSLHTYLLGL